MPHNNTKLHVLASGSSGNSYCIETPTDLIFIDMGVAIANINEHMGDIAESGKNISLFLTHEHNDHIKGLGAFFRKFKPKVYTSAGSVPAVEALSIPNEFITKLDCNVSFDFATFSVSPFRICHDASEPFGYTVNCGRNRISVITDLGYIPDEILQQVELSDTIILESNYDDDMLKNGSYPSYLKKRIASKYGHLSNREAVHAVTSLWGGKLQQCFFAHISEENNDYSLVDKYATYCKTVYNIDVDVLIQKQYKSIILDNRG